MLDYSGAITYSKIKEAQIASEGITLNVYPNPARGVISVDIWGEENENIETELIDITGKKIASYNLKSGSNILDISNYSKGIYFIKTTTKQAFAQQKLVIN